MSADILDESVCEDDLNAVTRRAATPVYDASPQRLFKTEVIIVQKWIDFTVHSYICLVLCLLSYVISVTPWLHLRLGSASVAHRWLNGILTYHTAPYIYFVYIP